MMRKKKAMPKYGKGTGKTKTKAKSTSKMSGDRKQREAAKLKGRGIPEAVVRKMLGTMGRGGMTTGAVMKKYGYGGTTRKKK